MNIFYIFKIDKSTYFQLMWFVIFFLFLRIFFTSEFIIVYDII
jgi:hypothetical protein